MKYLILFICIISVSNVFSSEIECHYNFKNNSFIIESNGKWPIERKYTENNLDYKIYIKNSSFNEVNDYMTIKNEKGHKITYSLECSSK